MEPEDSENRLENNIEEKEFSFSRFLFYIGLMLLFSLSGINKLFVIPVFFGGFFSGIYEMGVACDKAPSNYNRALFNTLLNGLAGFGILFLIVLSVSRVFRGDL